MLATLFFLMNKLKKILPNTLFGKALFLLVIGRIIGMFCFSLSSFLNLLAKIFREDFEFLKVRFFNVDNSCGWGVLVAKAFFETFFSSLSMFLVGATELAIVWMIVYVAFRMTRNSALTAKSFFLISVITIFVEYLLSKLVCLVNAFSSHEYIDELLSMNTLIMSVVFCILVAFAHWIFLANDSSNERELPKVYLKRFWNNLPENKLLLSIVLSLFVMRFCFNFFYVSL